MEVDINPIKKQTVSDDPELAKVLSGVNAAAAGDNADDQDEMNLQYEALGEVPELEMPEVEDEKIEVNQPTEEASTADNFVAAVGDLENIKNSALQDLRPLVDKLNATNEEKFNIYLLLLRSSDDKTLIEPAYSTARSIEDETKRANALLDIIKEIDYLNSKKPIN